MIIVGHYSLYLNKHCYTQQSSNIFWEWCYCEILLVLAKYKGILNNNEPLTVTSLPPPQLSLSILHFLGLTQRNI